MITISKFNNPETGGRLGNQLFQLNSLIGLSENLKQLWMVPGWGYIDYFNLPLRFGSFPKVQEKTVTKVTEEKFHYDVSQFTRMAFTGNWDIDGYLQSYKYFGKQKIGFNPHWLAEMKTRSAALLEGGDILAVHIRRGDYVGNEYYHELSKDYFMAGIRKMQAEYPVKKVFIFTDDIEYCKQWFGSEEGMFTIPIGNTDIEDLALMSLCDYHLLCNSTFGWWGAYLSESKKVLRPVKYFAGKGLKNDTKDFWPEEWEAFDHD